MLSLRSMKIIENWIWKIPNLETWLAATSILSAELLKVHLNSTSGGFASTIHFIWAFSCFATPCILVWFGAHVGASTKF